MSVERVLQVLAETAVVPETPSGGGFPGGENGSERSAPERRPLTDLGNAERLVDEHGSDIRFMPGLGWYAWDGRRWQRDADGEVLRRAKATVRAMQAEAAQLDDDQERKQLLRHALRSESGRKLRDAVSLAESDRAVIVPVAALDADPMLLNVLNGTLHLELGELVQHRREDLITKLTPVEFSYDATAPRWRSFLNEVFAGDSELIAGVQRGVGYSLTGSTSEQVLFIPFGPGANGKTTFIEVLRALFGEYGQQTPAETFLERRSDSIPNDVARLRGARFVAAVETGEGRRLNETLVKRLTGGDTITARYLFREFFEFRPAFTPWLATNHKPDVRGTDEAIWRRIRLVPFTVTIPERKRDPNLARSLRAELPGILRWAVEGCLAWQSEGLGSPDAVSSATAAYRQEMDVLGEFLAECCVVAPEARATAGELYDRYGYWVEAAGERERLTKTKFGLRLSERGFEQLRDKSARYWQGVGLRDEDADR